MKNAMTIGNTLLAAVTAVSILTGCNSDGIPTAGSTAISINNPAPISGGVNCTATAGSNGSVDTT